jgi:hypothetical protein
VALQDGRFAAVGSGEQFMTLNGEKTRVSPNLHRDLLVFVEYVIDAEHEDDFIDVN